MPATIRVAAAQYPIEALSSRQHFEDKLKKWVAEAAKAQADVLVFPEYGAMEFASAVDRSGGLDRAIGAVSEAVKEIDDIHRKLAMQYGVTIVGGSFLERRSGRTANVAHVFGPSGRMARYEKWMPTPWEREVAKVDGGRQLCLVDTGKAKIGILICYDVEFPLLSRALAEAGAQIIVAPSNTETEWGYWRVRTGAIARALENQLYTVHAPTVGQAPEVVACPVNIGAAGIFAPSDKGFPSGGVLALGNMNCTQWVHAELNLDLISEVRNSGGVQTYRHWWEQPGLGRLPSVLCVDISDSLSPGEESEHGAAAAAG